MEEKMPNMTLSVSKELKNKMDSFPEMNWSEVARSAFTQKVKDMEFLREFTSKSKLTQKDALNLGRRLNKGLAKRYI